MSKNIKAELTRIFYTVLGASILAIGTGWVLYAGEKRLFSVGLTGCLQVILLIFEKSNVELGSVFGNLGTLYLIFNIPLFILAYKHISKKFTYYSMLSVVVQSLFYLVPNPLAGQGFFGLGMLEIALMGGIMIGLGVGISMKVGSSTGGFDILFQYLSLKTQFSFDSLNLYINCIIVSCVIILKDFDFAVGILTFIRVVISVITTAHTNRSYNLVLLTIFTDRGDEVNQALLTIGRGISIYDKVGGYTQKEGKMLYCVMNRYEMKHCCKLIKEVDPKVLIIVTRAESVIGNFQKKVMA